MGGQHALGRLRWDGLHDFDGSLVSGNLLPSRDPRRERPDSGPSRQSDDQPVIASKRLVNELRSTAVGEGFSLLGITPAVTSPGYPKLVQWIESGYAGEMSYFAEREDAYQHPNSILDGVRSIVALAMPYDAAFSQPLASGQGGIARYAWSGIDYHDTVHPKLKRLCRLLVDAVPSSRARGVVDTAPLMEREVAELAGLGWRGKNTLLLNKTLGSYFFLACLLTDIELPYDSPHESAHCGTCTACLDACPTDAFPQAGVLDASRCISYLTIEHRGSIPMELRDGIGQWLFGCDVCQEVCPWNRKLTRRAERPPASLNALNLHELFDISDDEFRQRFRRTPLWRSRRRGLLRNAAIVLGNQRDAGAIAALTRGLADDEPIVRGASAWGLGKVGGTEALQALSDRRDVESEIAVRQEIRLALGRADLGK